MKQAALLDTHVLLWFDQAPERVPSRTLSLIRDRDRQVYVSAITAWELSIKRALGKLPSAQRLLEQYHATLSHYGFSELPLSSTHALLAGRLEHPHKDPFDRALVAQAVSERLLLVSGDPAVQAFEGVQVAW